MITRTLSFILPLAAVLAFGSPARADEKVALDQTPEKVQETVRTWLENGHLETIERRDEPGEPAASYYRVDFMGEDGTPFEIEVSEDGKVIRQRGRLN
jgi:hypothetical protein